MGGLFVPPFFCGWCFGIICYILTLASLFLTFALWLRTLGEMIWWFVAIGGGWGGGDSGG